MFHYINSGTAEIGYYNDLSDKAKDSFYVKHFNKSFEEMSPASREMFSKLSSKVKQYIDLEDDDKREELWYSYDKTSQYFCNIDKYIEVYGESTR
jgi:hypothetical protein